MLVFSIEEGGGQEKLRFPLDVNFVTFQFEVAKLLKLAPDALRLLWKTPDMKKTDTGHHLRTEAQFMEMKNHAQETLEGFVRDVKAAEAELALKAKLGKETGRKGLIVAKDKALNKLRGYATKICVLPPATGAAKKVCGLTIIRFKF